MTESVGSIRARNLINSKEHKFTGSHTDKGLSIHMSLEAKNADPKQAEPRSEGDKPRCKKSVASNRNLKQPWDCDDNTDPNIVQSGVRI